jgi:hypothetical protein
LKAIASFELNQTFPILTPMLGRARPFIADFTAEFKIGPGPLLMNGHDEK